jgi:hypothetical protein
MKRRPVKVRPSRIVAEAERDAAREQMFVALDRMKARLAPGALADDAMNGIADRATEIAAKRPVTMLAAAGAILLMVARRPLARWIASHSGSDDATPADPSR